MSAAAGRGAGEAGGEAAKELNLEPRHLTLLLLLVLGLCAASFLLGRWVERRALGPVVPTAKEGAGSGAIEDGGDVSKDLTFFDTLKGGDPAPLAPSADAAATPARPSAPRPVPREAAASASPTAPAPGRRSVGQGLMIQVMASKDRAAAEALRRRLRAKGYTALLVQEGGSYKVRVGPYADRQEAERAGAVLREQEKVQVWIP